MLKFLSFFSCWLLLSGSISQAPPAAFPDTPTITGNSVGKARLGMAATDLKKAYKNCAFSPTYLVKYGFDDYGDTPSAITVSWKGQKLLVFWTDATTKKVAGLIALHPAYQTAQGIHIGSTSRQLKKAFPKIQVAQNMMMQEIETAFAGQVEKPGIEYAFFKQGHVGTYLVADEPVKISATTARISWIQLYPH